jgi:hypothetical protein
MEYPHVFGAMGHCPEPVRSQSTNFVEDFPCFQKSFRHQPFPMWQRNHVYEPLSRAFVGRSKELVKNTGGGEDFNPIPLCRLDKVWSKIRVGDAAPHICVEEPALSFTRVWAPIGLHDQMYSTLR